MRPRICTIREVHNNLMGSLSISELDFITIPVLPTETHKMKRATQTIYERPINITCETDGSGFWSVCKRKIKHHKICLAVLDSCIFDLRVFFDKQYWDIEKDGLIYTDKMWIENLEKSFISLGFYKSFLGISYSEQGMQTENYVSLDINNNNFIQQYFEIFYTPKDKILNSFSSSLQKVYFR